MAQGVKDNLVVVIPARGGSKRIRGKNIRPLAGKPLVHHAIEYALNLVPKQVIVSTDSKEVAGVVRTRYPDVQIDRSFNHTDESTVDELTLYFNETFIHKNETLVVIQPTMIGEVVPNVNDMLAYIGQTGNGKWWVKCSGLRAGRGPLGYLQPFSPIDETKLIDIDTMSDFAAAETYLRKKTTIGIYYKSGEKQGWGHEKRARTLADALQDYDVTCEPIEWWKAELRLFRDVIILDIGDTDEKLMTWMMMYGKVITIEDNGPGARLAHATINPFTDLKYAVLRPEFYNLPEYVVRDELKNILLSFGGQDNHDMDRWVVDSLRANNHGFESWIEGLITRPKEGQMATSMLAADLLICAGGQTSYEAIKVGVPTIVIPALPTEAMRPHLTAENGIINLGLAPTRTAVWAAVKRGMKDKMLREDMSRRMKAVRVGDGAVEIRRIVEDLCQH